MEGNYNARMHVLQRVVYVRLGRAVRVSFFDNGELLFGSAGPPCNGERRPRRGVGRENGKGISSESTTLTGRDDHDVLDFMGPSSLCDCDGALTATAARGWSVCMCVEVVDVTSHFVCPHVWVILR